ncbi:hypothetical protein ABPG74_015812 [Tetrahymena malaccensis]
MSYDLNLKCADTKNTTLDFRYISLLTSCIQDDYTCIALNQEHNDMNTQIKPCMTQLVSNQTLQQSVEKSMNMQKDLPNVSKFEQLKRITLEINDGKYLPQLKSNTALATYDIIAIKTRNEKVFHSLCIDYDDYDILCFDMSERLPFIPKRGWIQEAVRKGISFEICYSEAIEDPAKKRTVLANCINIVKMTKGKNVIFSSSCSSDFDHRSPFDIIMLGTLIGLTKDQTHDALKKYPANCIKRSRYRKTYEGTISHASKNDIEEFKKKNEAQIERIQKKVKKNEEISQQIQSGGDKNNLKLKLLERNKKITQMENKSNNLFEKESQKIDFDPNQNVFLNPKRVKYPNSSNNQQESNSMQIEEEKKIQSKDSSQNNNNTSAQENKEEQKPKLLSFSITS